jgi:cation diffusion facilitator family transporter
MKLERIMVRSFLVNIFLVIIKVIGGIIFNSYALIADGVHSTSDLLSDVFVILGIRHSLKPADDEHPFGHGKFEYVLSFILGLSILLIAYNLGKNVIINFNDAIKVPSLITLGIVVLVVVIKLFLARYLLKKGKELDSQIISASGKESLTDVFSSIVVFFGIGSVIVGEMLEIDWLLKGDKVASIIIALFIVRIGIQIIFDAIKSMQGKSVNKEICNEYKKKVLKVSGVIDVDHLIMIAYGPYYQALVEIRVDGNKTVKEGHDIAENVTKELNDNEKICHVVVHVNPEV